MNVLMGMLLTVVAGLAAFIVWIAYDASTAPTIELRKDSWQCTKQSTSTVLIPVSTGKTTVLIPSQQTSCTQYERRS